VGLRTWAARIQHKTVKVGDLSVARGARVLTLDTGVGWRAATGARCPWTIGNALDADERSGPRWTDDTWLARGDTATAALLDGYARRDRAMT
jgi:hypothetical protein